MISIQVRLSKIVTPFPVFEEHWDPKTVMTVADGQDSRLQVKLLELLRLTRQRYKDKVTKALIMEERRLG